MRIATKKTEKLTQLKTEYEVIWTTVSWKLLSLMHNEYTKI